MSITNYGELQSEIQAYLYNRADLSTHILTFIALGEKKLFRRLRCRENETEEITTPPVSTSQVTLSVPSDYLETKMMRHYGGKTLTRKSELEIAQLLFDEPASGEPKYFGRVDDTFYFWPPPDSDDPVKHLYWQDLSGNLSLDADTNVVLTTYPDLYLYAALIEAMPFLVRDDRIVTWQKMFEETLIGVNESTAEQEFSGSVTSVGGAYGDR